MNVTPGGNVVVELKTMPTNAAACKTLVRLCSKDRDVHKLHRAQTNKRPSWQLKRRGGRMWHHQMESRPSFELKPGVRYTICATVDVVRDLTSVERFISVSPAK